MNLNDMNDKELVDYILWLLENAIKGKTKKSGFDICCTLEKIILERRAK